MRVYLYTIYAQNIHTHMYPYKYVNTYTHEYIGEKIDEQVIQKEEFSVKESHANMFRF